MNLFDLVAGLTLVVSALIGFSRGAVLEVVTLFAFAVASAIALYLLPFTGPLAQRSVHPTWAANAAAIVICFLVAYVALRVLGSSVSRTLRSQSTLGTIDRTAGLGFGVVRALVVLGVVYLVFAATPLRQPPPLIAEARLYPLTRASGQVLASVAPGGLKEMTGFGAGLKARMLGLSGLPQGADSEDIAGRSGIDPPASVDVSPASPQPRTLIVETGDWPAHLSAHSHHRHAKSAPVE